MTREELRELREQHKKNEIGDMEAYMLICNEYNKEWEIRPYDYDYMSELLQFQDWILVKLGFSVMYEMLTNADYEERVMVIDEIGEECIQWVKKQSK